MRSPWGYTLLTEKKNSLHKKEKELRFLKKVSQLYYSLNLQDPNMRGQVCWSMGKFFRIIGHFAFTVNLDRI